MDKSHQTALEMRYEGYSLREIARNTNMTYGSVRQMFAKNGVLFEEYPKYARERNQHKIEAAFEIYRNVTQSAAYSMKRILKRAQKRVDELTMELEKAKLHTPEHRLISEIETELEKAEDRLRGIVDNILDRAGLSIINKTQITTLNLTPEREEVINERLRKAGFDPDKLRVVPIIPGETEETLPN